VFERLRAAVNAALDAATPPPDWRDLRNELHRAAVDGRAALLQLRDALAKAERELASERRQLEDAQRRGTLAADVGDAETVAVAERFVARHGERVAMLEQKVAAQQTELTLTQRDVDEVVQRLKDLELRAGVSAEGSRVQPPQDVDDSELGATLDRAGREAEAEARLRELKNRMGR
jgi:uncharacterized coiled-coil protein SlyX